MAIITFSYLLILLLTSFPDLSDATVFANDAGRNQIRGPKLSTLATDKNPINYNRVDPVRGCSEMSTRSECVQSPKCRWCRSDAVDDTCFSKSEAWRLPSQVIIRGDAWKDPESSLDSDGKRNLNQIEQLEAEQTESGQMNAHDIISLDYRSPSAQTCSRMTSLHSSYLDISTTLECTSMT